MHILLTDVLTCPRCGPAFGLVVLADRLEDRRVLQGSLGCANCREIFPVQGGVVDLRHPLSPPLEAMPDLEPDAERAFRTAALLGVVSAGTVLIVEPAGALAPEVAGILPEAHVIGAAALDPAGGASSGMLSRIRIGSRLPFRGRSLRGAAVIGVDPSGVLGELARVLIPGARLVVDPAPADLPDRVRGEGFQLQLEQGGVVVAGARRAG